MINGIIGRKIGMTQIFAEDGMVTPVTVIKAGPCVVVQKKSSAGADGYDAVQVGLVDERPPKLKNVTKPMRGHFEKTGGGVPPTRILKEFRLDESSRRNSLRMRVGGTPPPVFSKCPRIGLVTFFSLGGLSSTKPTCTAS